MSGITTVKQDLFINSAKVGEWKCKIFGAGSIGSILAVQLAKTGFKYIAVYDFDTVEAENIGSQEYWASHIEMKKTDALKKLLKDAYDFDLVAIDGMVTEKTEILPEANTIYFCAFDSLEARKLVWDKLKNYPIVWGESRIGRTSQRFYFVDLRNKEKSKEWKEEYEKSLDPKGPRTELKCGEKGCYAANAELVAEIVRQMVFIAEGKDNATMMIKDWGFPASIFVMPEQEVPKEMKYSDGEKEEQDETPKEDGDKEVDDDEESIDGFLE